MNTVDEYYHPMNHRPNVEGMDREDSGMREDMAVEMEVVERESEGMVLMRHWTGNVAARHRQAHQEWEELAKLECSKGHTTFASRDSSCTSWCKV
jgi:hypothetical protein